jgi:glycosyltransferase involved in cell wall biosynthesis
MKRVCVEGWRNINHSYAMVNQFQLLEMAKFPMSLRHIDTPHYKPNWNAKDNSSGLSPAQAAVLKAIKTPELGEKLDAVFRIEYPFNFASSTADQTFVFGTTEHQTLEGKFVNRTPAQANADDSFAIVTPSQWSKQGFLRGGFSDEKVHVIPHGINPENLHIAKPEKRARFRRNIGLKDTDFALLSMGAMTPNKGVDVLVIAFALLHSKFDNLKLILKDQSNLYGATAENVINNVKKTKFANLLTDECMSDIFIISDNLTLHQIHGLYAAVDCLVSPYRAEGFNLTPLEAAACGIPIVVTKGGATDEFFDPCMGAQIESKPSLFEGNDTRAYLNPDLESLVHELTGIISGNNVCGGETGSQFVHKNYSWNRVTKQLVSLFGVDVGA